MIYYKQKQNKSLEQTVLQINNLIKQLKCHHTILGVFIDTFDESFELIELLNRPLEEIDYMYINKPIEDEFNKELIRQLSKSEQFEVKIFDNK